MGISRLGYKHTLLLRSTDLTWNRIGESTGERPARLDVQLAAGRTLYRTMITGQPVSLLTGNEQAHHFVLSSPYQAH